MHLAGQIFLEKNMVSLVFLAAGQASLIVHDYEYVHVLDIGINLFVERYRMQTMSSIVST